MDLFSAYEREFKTSLEKFMTEKSPKNLYTPMSYLIQLGGKRIRPFLCLMSAEAFGIIPNKAIGAALSVEVFHNFTLMHDDIMDSASLRRGKATVHRKWDINTAILSGDAMLIRAYQSLEVYPTDIFQNLTKLLSKTAIQLCEGQQLDIDFETQPFVSQNQYEEMIRLKTAVLIGCALKMGAILGCASKEDTKAIYDFGVQLGLAFQLQDDYLDAFGDQSTFGKKIGGDILENKKTILYHLAIKKANAKQADLLKSILKDNITLRDDEKISIVKGLFEDTGAKEATRVSILNYTDMAELQLEKLSISDNEKTKFRALKDWLINRKY